MFISATKKLELYYGIFVEALTPNVMYLEIRTLKS